jgi:hypothetical protein
VWIISLRKEINRCQRVMATSMGSSQIYGALGGGKPDAIG